MDRYIRCKEDGYIFGYSPILAKNPKCEVISEKEAFPERFMKKATKKKVAAIKSSSTPPLKIEVPEGDDDGEEDEDPIAAVNAALGAEASAGLK